MVNSYASIRGIQMLNNKIPALSCEARISRARI